MVTTTTYCSVNDIIDFLRVPITSTTTPNKEMVRKIIARKEEEFDRRVGHTWKTKKITREDDDANIGEKKDEDTKKADFQQTGGDVRHSGMEYNTNQETQQI